MPPVEYEVLFSSAMIYYVAGTNFQEENMADVSPGSDEWLAQVSESIIDSERPIVDPHHHLWHRPRSTYVLEHLWADTGSGHHITKTVFLECGASYHEDGPEHLKPIGETVFVEAIAAASR